MPGTHATLDDLADILTRLDMLERGLGLEVLARQQLEAKLGIIAEGPPPDPLIWNGLLALTWHAP